MAMPDRKRDTDDFVDTKRFAEDFFNPSTPLLRFDFGAATHVGNVRTNNEDHYAVVKRRRTSEVILTNLGPDDLVLTDDCSFAMVVADGMGGARFGELASRLALQRMFELAQQATSWVMKYTDAEVAQIRERVDAYLQEIQATLREYVDADPQLAGMGTTWTSAHLLPPHALVVHIGDSRAYLWNGGELRQVTRDESMAQVLIDSGMNPESVAKFRHLLLNSLSGDLKNVTAQVYQIKIEPADQLLLCSDGLTDMVADEDIATILRETSPPQAACEKLVAAALANGGKDNVTVVLAAVS
jgi:PPM family protein phosphatase